MKQIKFFTVSMLDTRDLESLEKQINEFMAQVKVIDVGFTIEEQRLNQTITKNRTYIYFFVLYEEES